MNMLRKLAIAALMLAIALEAGAQGQPTAAVAGRVLDPQGLPLPGVTVTASSAALQGVRTAQTSSNGDYILPFLPPGDYRLKFELSGFASRSENLRISLGQGTLRLDSRLSLQTLTEQVVVSADRGGDFDQNPAVTTSMTAAAANVLPIGRRPQDAALLAPGTNANAPGGGISIGGGMSFQNLFIVDGVVAQDNLRSAPLALYIEDAVQETTTSIAGISAEFGRFAGGVVNAVTRSGGNTFSGSYRLSLTNDSWTALTSFPGDRRLNKSIPQHEATFGGPVLKDKLWFFASGRARKFESSNQTQFTNFAYTSTQDEKRGSLKLTYALTPRHTLKAAYQAISDVQTNSSFQTILDADSLYDRETPQGFLSASYTGIVSPKFFVEAQYSKRHFSFIGSGSQYTDLIKGTLLLDQSRSLARFNSPTFCGVCDDETRDNENAFVKGSYFLSTATAGSHSIVGGLDVFRDLRFANNHQSGSDYRIYTTSAIIQGTSIFPVLDSNSEIRFQPIVQSSRGNDYRTYSAFANDVWQLNPHVSFNIGLRFDKNHGSDSVGALTVKDHAFSPRLAVTLDPGANGRLKVNVGYAKYVSAIANSIADGATAGGQPATIDFQYLGPNINTNPALPLVSTRAAVAQVFDWFNANGGTNRAPDGSVDIPGLTGRIDSELRSPSTREFSVGASRALGRRGLIRVDGVLRNSRDFYAAKTSPTDKAKNPTDGRLLDVSTTVNTNSLKRSYKALLAQMSFPIGQRLTVSGNYTLSEVSGNVIGETSASGPVTAGVLSYPEYFNLAWNAPIGDLSLDQRHKVRAWADWQTPLPEALGRLNLAALFRFDSGSPYGAAGSIDSRPYVPSLGYSGPPSSVTYYFTARDAFVTPNIKRTDLSLNWSRKLGVRSGEVFFRGTVQNVFNAEGLVTVNTSTLTRLNSTRFTAFNPFTTTPVQGTNWDFGTSFGKATSRDAYQLPRTYAFSLGVRF